MKLFWHYLKCLVRLLRKYICSILNAFVSTVTKLARVFTCFFLICKTRGSQTREKIQADEAGNRESLPDPMNELCEEETVDLTIIIPLYNVERYVKECMDSIILQVTNYTFEIILIDDESTDNTIGVIKEYLSDVRIRLLNQRNSGQSVARNHGIEVARGKYLMFVDGDDILLPDAIEKMMSVVFLEGADIVEGEIVNFVDCITDEMIVGSRKRCHVESNEKNPYFVLTSYGYSVAKIYKKKLWRNIRFPEGYIFEDVITKFILRRKANKVVYIGDAVYGYRRNNQSSSHGTNYIKKLDSVRVFPAIFDLCKKARVPFDDTFYLLSLNHIGLLNFVTVKNQEEKIQQLCFNEMQKQLAGIYKYRARHIPLMFVLLEKSIMECNLKTWLYVAETIRKYNMLKKWREIN